jgi:hypothetical protein
VVEFVLKSCTVYRASCKQHHSQLTGREGSVLSPSVQPPFCTAINCRVQRLCRGNCRVRMLPALIAAYIHCCSCTGSRRWHCIVWCDHLCSQLPCAVNSRVHQLLCAIAACRFFCGLPVGAGSHRLATHSNQANPTAGGPRQSLTREIRLTPLSQEVPSARPKIAWELNPHTSLACRS